MSITHYPVNAIVKVSQHTIANLLVGALEGGSNYWCTGVDVPFDKYDAPATGNYASDYIAAGHDFGFTVEDEGAKMFPPKHSIAEALQIMVDTYPEHFSDLANESDDAETSDVFFQILCFGEVVYG